MKRHWPALAALLMAAFCFALRSQTEPIPSIQWQWNDQRVIEKYSQSRVLQFGLRSDGVVVWRELVSQTNSPAESVGMTHRSGMIPRVVPPVTNPTPPLPR